MLVFVGSLLTPYRKRTGFALFLRVFLYVRKTVRLRFLSGHLLS